MEYQLQIELGGPLLFFFSAERVSKSGNSINIISVWIIILSDIVTS